MSNNDSGLVVAGLCFLGALAVLLVGACVLIAEAVVWLLQPYA
jgi:thiol:disulfide interchange protein